MPFLSLRMKSNVVLFVSRSRTPIPHLRVRHFSNKVTNIHPLNQRILYQITDISTNVERLHVKYPDLTTLRAKPQREALHPKYHFRPTLDADARL